MSREFTEFIEFLSGLVMLVIGLFFLSNNAVVTSSLLSCELMLGNTHINSLLIGVPLLIGLILGFLFPKKIWPKIVMVIGALFIFVVAALTTTVRLPKANAWIWLFYIVMIIGGAALLGQALFGRLRKDKSEK